jgi:purine-binding chemotaxis protein CheW
MHSPSERSKDDLWSRLHESIDRLAETGRQYRSPEAVARRLEARAKQLRHRPDAAQSAEESVAIVAFHKGGQRYGIPVEDVLEVQSLEQYSSVPGTPPFLPGVVHWRGQVLALLDLGKLMKIAEPGLSDIHVCLIVETGPVRIAVVALDVEDLLMVPQSSLKPPPNLPTNMPSDWLLGVYENHRMILRMKRILQDPSLAEWRT